MVTSGDGTIGARLSATATVPAGPRSTTAAAATIHREAEKPWLLYTAVDSTMRSAGPSRHQRAKRSVQPSFDSAKEGDANRTWRLLTSASRATARRAPLPGGGSSIASSMAHSTETMAERCESPAPRVAISARRDRRAGCRARGTVGQSSSRSGRLSRGQGAGQRSAQPGAVFRVVELDVGRPEDLPQLLGAARSVARGAGAHELHVQPDAGSLG